MKWYMQMPAWGSESDGVCVSETKLAVIENVYWDGGQQWLPIYILAEKKMRYMVSWR